MYISLAPMEGITTYIFRNAIAKYYGGIDRYYTPFLTASHLKGRELRDVHPDNNNVPELVPQILTNDSELFILIAKQLAALGYTEVNLNLGCPSGTVVSKGRGAGFLDFPDKLDAFLCDIFSGLETEQSNMNISIKTRIGMEFLSEWEDILKVYIKYPIKDLIIHPRLRNEFYNGEVHLDSYKYAQDIFEKKNNSPENAPDKIKTRLCYNGDITDIKSFTVISNKLKLSKDSDIMIGRGLIADPDLGNKLRGDKDTDESHVRNVEAESNIDIKKFSLFIAEITENYIEEMSNEKQVVMKMKELWTYFAKGLNLDNKLLKEIYKQSRLADYRNVIQMVLQSVR